MPAPVQNDPAALLDAQRQAEDVLLGVHEARLAAAREAEQAAEAAVQAATAHLLTARQAAQVAASDFDVARTLLRRPRPAELQRAALKLPLDVLLEVFQTWFLSDDREGGDSSALPCAFTAASVCQSWRSAALACPLLWSKIYVDAGNRTHLQLYIDTMLSRSRTSALEVEIENLGSFIDPDGRFASTPHICPDTLMAPASLAQLFGRSQTLVLRHVFHECLEYPKSILPFLLTAMPLLCNLTLEVSGVREESVPEGTQLLMSAPALMHLSISFLPFSMIHPPSLPSITTFVCRRALSADDIRSLAAAWTSLQTLDIRSLALQGSLQGNGPLPHFPKLQRVTLGYGASKFLSLTSIARLPCLMDVAISLAGRSGMTAFSNFVSGTEWTRLSCLKISDTWPNGLLPLFDFLPNLGELAISSAPLSTTTQFLDAWIVDERVMTPPHLATLRLTDCSFDVRTAQKLINLLARRRSRMEAHVDGVDSLRELYIQQSGAVRLDLVFPAWMKHRLEMLVPSVTLDTEFVNAYLFDDDAM
ncbi:hypothetical protein EXIGLDRAFT_776850 [Exidia glandulosa HHB12029]|uniref:Uncharacterized protein n=1 Tax=Exidia glandulosa HHB12029 TaxID=1314781 RepID=A0A165DBB6_EXIGL|nr:hypothetical protein EXIGLDRAFT_776850 [Exidia glandulosa HHB12029]